MKVRELHRYPYGVFYDPDVKDSVNAIRTSTGVIVYTNLAAETDRTMHSLEGVFETFDELKFHSHNPVCLRVEMPEFE